VNITGSSLPLLRNCQWWARPEVVASPQLPPSEAMELGTNVHEAIERALTQSDYVIRSDEAALLFGTWKQWWQSRPLGDYEWQAEVAYAYAPETDTARKMGYSLGRRYDTADAEIAGTIDAMALTDGGAVVIDWKTGSDFGNLVPHAAENWQLKLYALAVARAHGINNVTVVIARITPDEVRTTSHTLDAMDLDMVAAEVQALVASVATSKPTPGLHCRRCKAVATCPATATATDALVPVQPIAIEIKTPEQASAALVRLRQVQAACEQMEAMLKIYAINNDGIALPGGKRWVKTTVDRESISLSGQDMAMGVGLICEAGAESALESKTTTSKAAIERALKAGGLKGKDLRTKMDGLMSELRAAGVVRVASVDAWREVE
jgi:hypothetical protein